MATSRRYDLDAGPIVGKVVTMANYPVARKPMSGKDASVIRQNVDCDDDAPNYGENMSGNPHTINSSGNVEDLG